MLCVGRSQLEPGQFHMVLPIGTRFFQLGSGDAAVGRTTLQIDASLDKGAVEAILRDGKAIEFDDDTEVVQCDILAVSGRIPVLDGAGTRLGREGPPPDKFDLVGENREVVLTNRLLNSQTIQDLHDETTVKTRHGVFITGVVRAGRDMPTYPGLALRTGDELRLTGRTGDLDRVQGDLGYKISAAAITLSSSSVPSA